MVFQDSRDNLSAPKGLQIMSVIFKAAIALIGMTILAVHLTAAQSADNGPMSTKEAHIAETTAKTVADHRRLATYYQFKAQQEARKLEDATSLLKHWEWMRSRTKTPNAYTQTRSLVEMHRAQLEKASKLAAIHQRLAEGSSNQ
jgi:murein L,D-transpeptidase YcbB/YkuD